MNSIEKKLSTYEQEERLAGKELYQYQKGAIQKIFECFESADDDYHLLYQLEVVILIFLTTQLIKKSYTV